MTLAAEMTTTMKALNAGLSMEGVTMYLFWLSTVAMGAGMIYFFLQRKPAKYDELLVLETTLRDVGHVKIEHSYRLCRGDEELVIGETGSGKTTQLPKICLHLGRGIKGLIGHTQPRRLAARSVASRIASELKSPLGDAVGFKIRFADKVSQQTLIKVMTDGILLAETQTDPDLKKYDTIIID